MVSFLGGKVGVARGKSIAKIILECVDCTFGDVAALGIRGKKLEVDVVLVEGFLRGMGEFIVEDVDIGRCTVFLELFMARLPGCINIQGLLVLEKLGVDGVGVVVVEDEDILVSA